MERDSTEQESFPEFEWSGSVPYREGMVLKKWANEYATVFTVEDIGTNEVASQKMLLQVAAMYKLQRMAFAELSDTEQRDLRRVFLSKETNGVTSLTTEKYYYYLRQELWRREYQVYKDWLEE